MVEVAEQHKSGDAEPVSVFSVSRNMDLMQAVSGNRTLVYTQRRRANYYQSSSRKSDTASCSWPATLVQAPFVKG
jgi:Mg-chelatase subunit ChlD